MIYAISDLHGQIPSDPPGDITSLLVVGDICPDYIEEFYSGDKVKVVKGEQRQAKWLDVRFREWANYLGIPIYATFGNHDFIGEYPFLWPDIPNVEFVIDDARDVEGYKTWFYPYTPHLSGCALKAEPSEGDKLLAKAPNDIDILATHGPPLGAGDAVPPNSRFNGGMHPLRVGDESVMRAIPRIDPKVTVCGHIHEDRGTHLLPGSEHVVVNVSSMNDFYVQHEHPFVSLGPYLDAS